MAGRCQISSKDSFRVISSTQVGLGLASSCQMVTTKGQCGYWLIISNISLTKGTIHGSPDPIAQLNQEIRIARQDPNA